MKSRYGVAAAVFAAVVFVMSPAFAQFGDASVAREWIDWILDNIVWVAVVLGLIIVGIFAIMERSLPVFMAGVAIVLIIGGFFSFAPEIATSVAGG